MNLTKNLIPILAVIIALFLSAFTLVSRPEMNPKSLDKKLVTVWYIYIGPRPPTKTDLRNPANWMKIIPAPADATYVCPRYRKICAARITDNGTNPAVSDLTDQFADAILLAETTETETADIQLTDDE